ncbi:hypothetical protein NC653_032825 [Populus alba x Populus x berolinensis]|uniref:Uncharacterized protein n=1 Tax=Populus alba x Populus x berolinensis TaxID=444605 RepID=A0AAD6LSE8_9ROSI|nr:hypothetical protein NC653_032825 [Populus alba x Populus x berolinensis]
MELAMQQPVTTINGGIFLGFLFDHGSIRIAINLGSTSLLLNPELILRLFTKRSRINEKASMSYNLVPRSNKVLILDKAIKCWKQLGEWFLGLR